MEKEKLDLEALHTVTPEEFQQHFDVLTEEARTGNVPLRIRAEARRICCCSRGTISLRIFMKSIRRKSE